MSSAQPSFFHNTWLIAKREYVERIRAKSFIVMTILIPTLMGGLTFAVNYATGKNAKSDVNLAIVTQDSRFGLDLQQELAKHKHPKITADVISPPGADTRDVMESQLNNKNLDGYLWVTPPVPGHTSPNFEWKTRAKGYINTQNELGEAIRTVLTREGLAHSGMGTTDVEALMQPIDLDASSASKDSAASGEAVAMGLFFIMYFVILFYGMNVARSIIEEKTSRIFEVLLATIRPEEMMAGKVLGVGSVGLTQVGIWLLGAVIISARSGVLSVLGDDVAFNITARQGIFFVIFFFLGYTLYSGMAAALGAMTSSEQELQQMNIFLMLPLIACSGVVFTVVSDPNGTVAKVFSFIPFCTPLIMYVRIAVSPVPWYEIAISLAGLVLTITAILWFAARIYRVGILMYGKKPNLPELLRWLKYS
jgi:ABC-2 type transport system permease protein